MIHATTQIVLKNMLCKRSQTQKATQCDSIDVKCPEEVNPQKQKEGY